MAALHLILGAATMAGALVLVGCAVWSAILGRRSRGRRDHRMAVDRAVLVVLGTMISASFLGAVMLVGGLHPADPLHLVYGPAGLIGLPIAILIGARSGSADSSRVRRDVWSAGGGIVLLGIVLRLFATG